MAQRFTSVVLETALHRSFFGLEGRRFLEALEADVFPEDEQSCAGLLRHYLRLKSERGNGAVSAAFINFNDEARSKILSRLSSEEIGMLKSVSVEISDLVENTKIVPVTVKPLMVISLAERLLLASGICDEQPWIRGKVRSIFRKKKGDAGAEVFEMRETTARSVF